MLHVSALSIYPVKALQRVECSSFSVRYWGPENDRRWLITDPDGVFITQRTIPALACLRALPTPAGLILSCDNAPSCDVARPDETTPTHAVRVWKDTVQAQDAGDGAAHWLTQHIKTPCRLVYMPHPESDRIRTPQQHPIPVSFADGYPLLIATTASLTDLNSRLENPVPMTRFRPNIVIAGSAPWAEDYWRRLRIGTTILRISAPCSRCVVTTTDQNTGTITDRKEPLRTLAQFRRTSQGIMFAQNTIVEQEGIIQIGDRAEILEQGPSNIL